jgi:uncharacterized protein
MQDLITKNLATVVLLCRTHHVKRLAVFGSVVREDFQPEQSDVDLLVEFEPLSSGLYLDNKYELHQALESLFKRNVDLITRKSIENPYLLKEIENTKQDLYAA